MRNTSIDPQDEVTSQESQTVLADYGGGLHQVPKGVRRVLEI
jgi:hypothetical protein